MVPAASGPKQLVVNGMSPSNRDSKWANAGIVVEIQPDDLRDKTLKVDGQPDIQKDSPLAVMQFQEQLEEICWLNGGMKQTAPAQRMADFIQRKNSSSMPVSSYTPGLLASPLHFWIPEFITSRLRDGFWHT